MNGRRKEGIEKDDDNCDDDDDATDNRKEGQRESIGRPGVSRGRGRGSGNKG